MKKGFTLTEVLIALSIIGVIATLTIPTFFVNAQQSEFRTDFRKALNVVNNAIDLNFVLDGDTPLDMKDYDADCNGDGIIDDSDTLCFQRKEDIDGGVPKLAKFLMRHMNILKTTLLYEGDELSGAANYTFYTLDGMRFEVPIQVGEEVGEHLLPLYEDPSIMVGTNGYGLKNYNEGTNGSFNVTAACGAYGLKMNPNRDVIPPCMLVVDINGDKKPNPSKINVRGDNDSYAHDKYKSPAPKEKRLGDVYVFMIADRYVVPYGQVAQRALYEVKKKKRQSGSQESTTGTGGSTTP